MLLAAAAGDQALAKMPAFCHHTPRPEISALFDKWNAALKAGNPQPLVDLYAPGSVLLPTLSNQPRVTPAEKLDYFKKFLALKPSGERDVEWVDIGCNAAVDTGLYTFHMGDGSIEKARYTFTYSWRNKKWLITSHHSSKMPE
ncbi:DUF4440 domain-containing protein [Xylophilus rhododendri]|uniref:DUF4440 domain-containing protein n=2 Tax=Xylophilus rhododendri TaxID=2697032 RepID=A0A857JDZ1_9BURK|nr:DUF4440 domain-containing protein [Xylophilus rhododendri]